MIMLLDFLTQRKAVFALAVIGAAIVMLASRPARDARRRRQWNMTGYIVTGCSVLLFIIAGFRND